MSDQRAAARPSWDAYFLAMAMIASTRSTCLRRRVGAVLALDNRVLATGYNGAPAGCLHCAETGCLREQLGVPSGERHEICRGSHAETNAIAQAAKFGARVDGSTVYCTHEPCSMCSKMLINAGCRRVVYINEYPDDLSMALLRDAGVTAERYAAPDAVRRVLEVYEG